MFQALSLFMMMLFITPVFANPNRHQHPVSPLATALRVGTDTNGTVLYLCRAKLFNSIQPGKTWAGYGRCNVPYGGKEYVVAQYMVPDQREFGNYNWERGSRSAMQIGKDTNGNPLFVCQANFNGSIQPGKTWQGYNHCNISYGGREIITDYYRVLSTQQEIVVGSPAFKPAHLNRIHSHF
jgi:hypothetical protein